MANLEHYLPFLRKWEGGYSDHPDDAGGATQCGVTLTTMQMVYPGSTLSDLQHLSETDWRSIVERTAWAAWHADAIENQAVAEMLVDWTWMSGRWGIILPQAVVGVVQDGRVGPQTLQAVNTRNARRLWEQLRNSRKRYYFRLVQRRPRCQTFLNGWLNRLRDLKAE